MKNVVNSETAKALKEAGFPQPKPEVGQFWYRDGKEYVCYFEAEVGFCFLELLTGESYTESDFLGANFAPTAPDILNELGGMYYLSIEKFGAVMHKEVSDEAIVGNHRCFGVDVIRSDIKEPAEAAAIAWLEKNSK